jgi:hypothetical protein
MLGWSAPGGEPRSGKGKLRVRSQVRCGHMLGARSPRAHPRQHRANEYDEVGVLVTSSPPTRAQQLLAAPRPRLLAFLANRM